MYFIAAQEDFAELCKILLLNLFIFETYFEGGSAL